MIKNLVFEGGGIKGIAYSGAIRFMEKSGLLSSLEKIAGTSAGAIIAGLLALGYTSKEIFDIMAETSFESFKDDDFGIVRDIHRLINEFGLYKGDAFLKWFQELIERKVGYGDLTFGALHNYSEGLEHYKDLYVVATDLSSGKELVLSHETYPDMQIAHAVRMSMSIPGFFRCVKMDLEGDGKANIIVDGGLTCNYPIHIFDGQPGTYGFKLDTKDEIVHQGIHGIGTFDNDKAGDNVIQFFLACFNHAMAQANKKHLSGKHFCQTCFIDTLDIGTVDFDLSKEDSKRLSDSGFSATEKFFFG